MLTLIEILKKSEEYLAKHPPKKKVTLVDEPEPLGTGGAIKNIEEHIDGQFLVINGDSVSSLDLTDFISYHRHKKAFATISLWPVEDPTPYGVVDLSNDGRIKRFQEKPKREEAFSNLINAGVYALERDVLDHIGKGFVSLEREVFPKIIDRGMFGLRFDGYWIDCGRREDLLKAYWTLMGDELQRIDKTSVYEGAALRKPVVLEGHSVVAGASVGPHAYISARAVVGLRSTVERSVVLEDARIGTRCRIVDSIIDAGVTVPDGTSVEAKIVSTAKQE